MDISIIIVNYRVKDYIVSCIDSIYKKSSSKCEFEIIVVDNCSNDGSVNSIRNRFPEVIIIKNDTNIGFAKAINQGAENAMGKFFLILNPDTLFTEDSLYKLISFAKIKDKRAVIGPMLVSELQEVQQSFWRKPTLINTILSIYHLDFLNHKKNYKDKKNDKIICVDSISGGVFFTRSTIFRLLRGFNEDLFWMEDIDYCIRVKNLGYKNYYFPETKIIHYKGKSAIQNLKISISNQLLSKIKFFKIYHSRFSTFILIGAILLNAIIKSILLFILSPFNSFYRKKMIAYNHVIYSILFNSQ